MSKEETQKEFVKPPMTLSDIQTRLHVPKAQTNTFGRYNFRSCEDILRAVKPLLQEAGASIIITDSIQQIGERIYVRAEATLTVDGKRYDAVGYAREAENKKGMDESQVTGACSSYARKYALNGLLAIDDTEDSDATSKEVDEKELAEASLTERKHEVLDMLMDEKYSFVIIDKAFEVYGYLSEKADRKQRLVELIKDVTSIEKLNNMVKNIEKLMERSKEETKKEKK